jgi:hypothetical protein
MQYALRNLHFVDRGALFFCSFVQEIVQRFRGSVVQQFRSSGKNLRDLGTIYVRTLRYTTKT